MTKAKSSKYQTQTEALIPTIIIERQKTVTPAEEPVIQTRVGPSGITVSKN